MNDSDRARIKSAIVFVQREGGRAVLDFDKGDIVSCCERLMEVTRSSIEVAQELSVSLTVEIKVVAEAKKDGAKSHQQS